MHCSDDQTAGIADSLWEPLLADDDDSQDDGARNVKAACIGKLTSSNPGKYIPELRVRARQIDLIFPNDYTHPKLSYHRHAWVKPVRW